MAIGSTKIIKSLVVTKDSTLTPSAIQISPLGTNNTTTTVTSSQTSNVTVTLPNATDTLTGRQTTDTLQNKTLLDGNNYLANTADPTKRATFDLSEIPTATTRNFKLPDTGGSGTAEIVTDFGNQLIQDKSLLASATYFVSDDLGSSVQFGVTDTSGGAVLVFANASAANYIFPPSTADLATLALEETLTNKTLITPVIDSILTNGGAATVTLPTTTDTLVGRNTTDTLTNKTLTTPRIASILTNGGASTVTLPTSTDTLVGRNTSDFLQNKTLSYPIVFDAFSIVDQGVDPATPAAGYKNLYAKALGMYYRTSAGNVRQLANLDEAQVLTNKDIDGGTASNTSRITVPKATKATLDGLTRKEGTIVFGTDTDKLYVDDGTNLVQVGSGAGSINFVTNPDAETGTTGWTVDSFAATSRPAGAFTGVTTGVTWTTSASSPLVGSNSFLLTKDAANRQGRVVYTGITFTSGYFASVMNISAKYIVSSGTFVAGSRTTDSDVIFYLQNVSDGTFIEPSSFKLLSNSSTIPDTFNGTFQTGASATSYRLLIYIASTSASAYTLKFDDIVVTPSTYSYGTPITDWQSYTPTITGAGTPTSVDFKWRRVGDSIDVFGTFTTGTVSASAAQFTLPFVADGTKMSTYEYFGDGIRINATASTRKRFKLLVSNGSNTVSYVSDDYTTAAGPASGLAGNVAWANTEGQRIYLSGIPISGFSSSVQMSDQTDTRVVTFSGTTSAGTSTTSGVATNIPFTVVEDSHGAWNGTQYVVRVAGKYNVSANVAFGLATWTQGRYNIIYIYRNGAIYKTCTNYIQYTASQVPTTMQISAQSIPCNVGDTLEIRVIQNEGTRSINTTSDENTLSISRVSGPDQIAANEFVAGVATGNPASVTTGNPFIFPTSVLNTHGAYNTTTGRFTCPVSGTYEIIMNYAATGGANATLFGYKNGSIYGQAGLYNASLIGGIATIIIPCVAGEIIDLRPNNTVDISDGQISFKRLGF